VSQTCSYWIHILINYCKFFIHVCVCLVRGSISIVFLSSVAIVKLHTSQVSWVKEFYIPFISSDRKVSNIARRNYPDDRKCLKCSLFFPGSSIKCSHSRIEIIFYKYHKRESSVFCARHLRDFEGVCLSLGLVSLQRALNISVRSHTPGLSNVAPMIYFPGALIYSAGFNVNKNFEKKIFLNNSMFQFFS
jgi:hypothetical protein